MVPSTRKKASWPQLEYVGSHGATAHGGQILIETLCRRYGVWDAIAEEEFVVAAGTPVVSAIGVIAQLLFTLTTGGKTLADAARLAGDSLLTALIGLENPAGETSLRKWLTSQTERSIDALRRSNANFVRSVLENCPADEIASDGYVEVRFSQMKFPPMNELATEAADPDVSWQTLSIGPFLLDGVWDKPSPVGGPVRSHLCHLLERHRTAWQWKDRGGWKDLKSYFQTGSAPVDRIDRSKWRAIAESGFDSWALGVSITDVIDTFGEHWNSGKRWLPGSAGDSDQYLALYPPAGEGVEIPGVAVAARRPEDGDEEYKYRYLFLPRSEAQSPDQSFRRHRLALAKAIPMDGIITDFGLRQLPFSEIEACAAFYSIASLAYNLVVALKWVGPSPCLRSWSVREIMRGILTCPCVLRTHSRARKARVHVPFEAIASWQQFIAQCFPRLKRGRPRLHRRTIGS